MDQPEARAVKDGEAGSNLLHYIPNYCHRNSGSSLRVDVVGETVAAELHINKVRTEFIGPRELFPAVLDDRDKVFVYSIFRQPSYCLCFFFDVGDTLIGSKRMYDLSGKELP